VSIETNRLRTIACVAVMGLGLATAASAHPGLRARFQALADRAAARIDLAAVDEPLLAAAIFAETNQRRSEHGLEPLRHHPVLSRMAARHADRMATRDFYSHRDPFEPRLAEPVDRARRAGIGNPHIGENIHDHRALESDTGPVFRHDDGNFATTPDGPPIPPHTYQSLAVAVVDEWMASDGHRNNILHHDAVQLGVGVRFYWREGGWPFIKAVQNFQMFEAVELSPH
jgi:uncharacterized protein YkwD